MADEKHVYGPFDHGIDHAFERADLEFYGINHFRPTFVARIYFNDKEVTARNANEKRKSYAGKLAMLGHEQCYGDEGHCDVPTTARRFDDRPSHPLTPAFRRVEVTEALRRAVKKSEKLSVTVIVTTRGKLQKAHSHRHDHQLFEIKGLQLVTFG